MSQPDFEQPLSAQLVVLVTVAAFISCAWPRRSPGGFRAPSLAWAMFALLVLVVAVRQATTRGDGHHFLIGAVFTGAFVLLASTAVSSRARNASLLSFICLGLMPYVGGVQASADLIFRMSSAVQGIAAVIRADDPRRTLDRRLADAVDRARSLARVPGHIDGTFDIVGYDHTLLLALPRSQWAPRPVLQSYAAYTPHLAALNAGHFASGHAPRWVIARVQTIDGRWPMQDDARVWAQLVRHYVAGERLGDYLLLRRRGSNEIERDAVEPVTLDLHLTDWTDVPRPRAGVWYARFALPRACSARLLSSVWKPAACHLEVVVENDPRSYRFRLVRAIAADGFVLSPMIRNTDALEGWLRGGRGHAVARLRLLDDDGRPVPVGVRLTSVPPGWPDPAPVQGPDVPAKVDR